MAFDTIGACRDDCGAVTVGNEAPVWQRQVPAGQSRDSRLALAGAQQRYDDIIGDFPV
jgi:hypothetical protein